MHVCMWLSIPVADHICVCGLETPRKMEAYRTHSIVSMNTSQNEEKVCRGLAIEKKHPVQTQAYSVTAWVLLFVNICFVFVLFSGFCCCFSFLHPINSESLKKKMQ